MCTWVWVTLNGVVTSTRGAADAVDPVTATLPVAPSSVHSGVPPAAEAAVGRSRPRLRAGSGQGNDDGGNARGEPNQGMHPSGIHIRHATARPQQPDGMRAIARASAGR